MKVTIDMPKGTTPEQAQLIADTVKAACEKLNEKQWRILRRCMNASSIFLKSAFGKISSALDEHNIPQ